jgi:hypothetical protein
LDASGRPVTAVVGHGIGGYLSYAYAAQVSGFSLPAPWAVLSVEPAQAQIPTYDVTKIKSGTFVMTVVGDKDKTDNQCVATQIWTHLTSIADIYKPFLIVRSDSHGAPEQLGN